MATITKKDLVVMELVGLDSNAFSIMGAFRSNAKRQGWTKDEIEVVLKEAMSGDYNHLLATIMDNVQDPEDEDEDKDEDEDEDEDEDRDHNHN